MQQHRILRSEAFEPRPLAYVQMFPGGRRPRGSYFAAGAMGALIAIGVLFLMGLIAGILSAPPS